MRFLNQTVFVTGASRGIGLSIVKAFKSEGARVIGTCTKKKSDDLGAFCDELFEADFSDLIQIQNCASFLKRVKPDILINNAGINKISSLEEVSLEDFQSIQQVNVLAPFILCQAAIPSMKLKGWGRIINVSSIWGKRGASHRAAYSASKFALDGLTVALATEYAEKGIIANCIAPGFIDTSLTRQILGEVGLQAAISRVPTRRLGTVKEVAGLVLWLASADNTFVSGQNISIDGGFSRA
jgi:3-oxoacyl-[acyl-carrier protein] reductase